MKRDAQKINCENTHGKIAKVEKAAKVGLERLRERIHRRHESDIRTGLFNRQHFSLFIFTGFSRVFPSRFPSVALAFPMPICQHAFISRNHANIRMTLFGDSRTDSQDPIRAIRATRSRSLNATASPAIVDAMTLSEVINLTNPAPIHGESSPAFRPDSCLTHSLIMSGIMHSLATLATRHALISTSDTGRHTAHAREARNLFCGHKATAVAPYPTQPDSQPKSISVALPTATETPFLHFPCSIALSVLPMSYALS
jgi:hypothetical protein